METKIIYKVTEIISDDWNAKNKWLAIADPIYFSNYKMAEEFRNKREDEFTKYAIAKIYVIDK